jgi:drug/metabolite transporter (DMT)-like permease
MKRAYMQLHIAVLLFGFTGILGRLITLDAVPLVWWRVFVTTLSLLILFASRGLLRGLNPIHVRKYIGIGVLVALHWITFFWSIKLANVSIALVAFATQSFFTAICEPIITRSPFRRYELAIGFLVLPAMWLIVNEVDLSMQKGLLVGVISALLMATFTSMTKNLIHTATPVQITFFQIGGAWLFITLLLPFLPGLEFSDMILEGMDIIYLLALALACTTLAYVLSMHALKFVNAFTANLAVNLEPIYGILLAAAIFAEHEQLSSGFYAGAILMISTIFIHAFIRRATQRRQGHA